MLQWQNIAHFFWQAKISDLQKFEELPSLLLSIIVIQLDHLMMGTLAILSQGRLPRIEDELAIKEIAKTKNLVSLLNITAFQIPAIRE